MSDKRVRQALAYAISRADLLDLAEQGLAVPQYSFVQPTNTRWVNNAVSPYEFDLARARQLLLDAGYQVRNGLLVGKDGQAVKLQVLYPSSSAPRGKIAAYGGGSLDPDLGPRAQLITNGQQNVTGYANRELFKQAANELDDVKRKQLYDQVQTLVNADIPSDYLYALKSIDAFSRKVQNVTPHKGDRLDYNNALLSWSDAQ